MKNEKVLRQMVEHHQRKNADKNIGHQITWWQLSLIGVGSIVGAGFFLGIGLAISLTGPSVLIALVIAGITATITFEALTQLKLQDPKGSFRTYSRKAFGDAIGYINGWMYFVAGVLIMSSEVTALSLFTQYWLPHLPLWIFSIVYSILGLFINLLGIKDFGAVESFFAIVKISTLVLFILFGVIILFGWRPSQVDTYKVVSLFHEDWFPKGIKGLWSSMIYALFPFGGIAVVAAAANEIKDKTSISKAVHVLITSLISLYLLSIFFILSMVSWNQINEKHSPFVTTLSIFNIPFISSIFNFVIICAAFSTFVGALYSVSSVLISLAEDHEAPKQILNKSKRGVSVPALLLSALGLVVTIILSFLLPKSVYEYLTTAAGILLISNWLIILASKIKLTKKNIYVSVVGIALILLTIAGAALKISQRIGLLFSLGILLIIAISYKKFIKNH